MKYIINNQKTKNKNLFDKVIKEINNKNRKYYKLSLFDILGGVQFILDGNPVSLHQLPPETYRIFQIR